jgi:hypothetical protein
MQAPDVSAIKKSLVILKAGVDLIKHFGVNLLTLFCKLDHFMATE